MAREFALPSDRATLCLQLATVLARSQGSEQLWRCLSVVAGLSSLSTAIAAMAESEHEAFPMFESNPTGTPAPSPLDLNRHLA